MMTRRPPVVLENILPVCYEKRKSFEYNICAGNSHNCEGCGFMFPHKVVSEKQYSAIHWNSLGKFMSWRIVTMDKTRLKPQIPFNPTQPLGQIRSKDEVKDDEA